MSTTIKSFIKPLASLAIALLVAGTPLIASAAITVGGVNLLDPLGLFSSKGGVTVNIGGGGGITTCANTICSVASTFLYLINNVLVPLLFAVAFIVFLYGVADTYIFSRGDPERVGRGHQLILWGIIGFVVMISLWGLVNIVANTFQLNGYSAPTTPVSYPSSY